MKYLKFKQVFYRLYYKFKKPSVGLETGEVTQFNNWQWTGPSLNATSILGPNKVIFLNKEAVIESQSDWNTPEQTKLWLYNLHYFDDLCAIDYQSREQLHYDFINRWIDENPPCLGNGWEPYPLSLRLVNWVKWFSQKENTDVKYLSSIAQQSDALMQQLEYHILGNHLFANAKALTFVGAFLKDEIADKFVVTGLKILDKEVNEQFLGDGAHFELSPMYHCILLWDLLELIDLGITSKNKYIEPRLPLWKGIAEKALTWLETMNHPDGDVSFFNDAAIGIAHKPAHIFEYAKKLGIVWQPCKVGLTVNKASGYSRVNQAQYSLIFDHANVGPDYLPGHAHADTLSFEMSVGNERVFVNSGTSLYGVSAERLRQRETAAHNTVEIGGESSSEVWSGFRVARRAYAKLLTVKQEADKVTLVARHNGYSRFKPKVIHTRAITSNPSYCQIEDSLSCKANACYYLHLHPKINANVLDNYTVELNLMSGKRVLFTSEQPIKLVPSTYHPEFGVSIESNKIQIPFSTAKLVTRIEF
ncbi:heparinase II/III family protein [Catenovulum maritimum]|nr:alginate lyase family protein [Catenovulum maritimum]